LEFDVSGSAFKMSLFIHQISLLWCAFNTVPRIRGNRPILNRVRGIKNSFFYIFWCVVFETSYLANYVF
jgi:hypothetical protein